MRCHIGEVIEVVRDIEEFRLPQSGRVPAIDDDLVPFAVVERVNCRWSRSSPKRTIVVYHRKTPDRHFVGDVGRFGGRLSRAGRG
jgi:hypothetical protein